MRMASILIWLLAVAASIAARPKCGKPSVTDQGFHIFNGEIALKGQWPWMVSIEMRPHVDMDTYDHICGGALMENGWIVTAAHCFEYEDAELYRVVLGQHDRLKPDEVGKQIFPIKVLVEHENFWLQESDDIALIKVDGEVTFTKWVKPICSLRHYETMEWLDDVLEKDDQALDCVVAGWGITEEFTRSRKLRYTQMSIWPRASCSEKFDQYSYDPKSNLCAQNKDSPLKDACKADSGGPIFCRRYKTESQRWDRWRLYGIVSWGEDCGQNDNPPGIYTNIMTYTNWMKCKMKNYSDACPL